MRIYTLSFQERLARPLKDVFQFFERPENLQLLTPPWARMQFLTPSPIPMHVGSAIDYVIRIHGVPLRWTTLITEYDPPNRFVDVQLRGPYALWHHTHTFEAVGESTIVGDVVQYAMPLGPLGALAHAAFVKRDLGAIFAHRAEAIRRKLGSS